MTGSSRRFPPPSADRKLTSVDDDRLGYGSLADHIARVISSIPLSDGLVIAIFAPWGAGKSTFLHFIGQAVKNYSAPHVVAFNPWWFSGEEDLTRRFFEQLALSLASDRSKWKRGASHAFERSRHMLSEQVAELALLAGKAPVPYAQYAGILGDALKRLKRNPRGIQEVKAETEKQLSSLRRHVLVLVDDVDRLTPEDIRQLFKVIKSVGDLTNIIYVLALDRRVAEESLGAADSVRGRDYMEKIIQASFELPLPDRVALRSLFLEGIGELVGEERLTRETASSRWLEVYPTIEAFFDTPRNVGSLLNALRISYPLVESEVNLTDLIAIETLHVFMPDLWDLVRRSASFFARGAPSYA